MDDSEAVNDLTELLVWVPTKGNEIPAYAVAVAGEADVPLYVARCLIEGEMRIGTTSHISSEGALLYDGHGRRTIFEYEVLTCASTLRFHLKSQPMETRRVKHQSISQSQTRWDDVQSTHSPVKRRADVQLKYFNQSKCFTLIDDSPTMQYSWSQTRAALTGAVERLSSDDQWEGMNLRFLHHPEVYPCIKAREECEAVFNSLLVWESDKAMATKVKEVFQESVTVIRKTERPVILLIITDAIASDAKQLSDDIVCFCQELNDEGIHPRMFRMYMLQMGSDRKAVKPLRDFNDQVTEHDCNRDILDVISFHPGRGLLNADKIIKLLVASTNIPDEEDPELGEKQPPGVVAVQYAAVEKMKAMGPK